ncbi:hypothetical protein SCP_1200810 [Sparassis crispa]|uniref:F-box domain-containing protein n=1 Tax=Sparassis crispa TaxID=139825 RepID=A0A401H098_9APHY|nr:hypothetical protein SCP_1200810 [Sparassis crispa]GBE87856.1 hypothetical protein SCP_1200810 [Sparassis crispa]
MEHLEDSNDPTGSRSLVVSAGDFLPVADEQRTSEYQNAKHSIHRLPVELLTEIFLDLTYSYPHHQSGAYASLGTAPLLLCRICSLWRRVALRTPALWCWFSLSYGLSVSPFVGPKLMRCWLERSGSLPLRFTFAWYQDYISANHISQDVVVEMLRIFADYITRWEEVTISTHTPLSLAQPSSPAPLLRVLRLEGPEVGRVTLLPFTSAPQLRSLRWCLSERISGPLQSITGVPWAQLTELQLDNALSLYQCFKLLKMCPALVQCYLLVSHADHNNFPSNLRITHATLRDFAITVFTDVSPLLRSLVLPALQKFEVENHFEYMYEVRFLPPSVHSAMMALLSNSACVLTTFRMTNLTLTSAELIECLMETGAELEEFGLSYLRQWPVVMDGILEQLTYRAPPAAPCLCPNLKSLDLRNCVCSTDGVLAAMIESWCCGSSVVERLQKCSVVLSRAQDMDMDAMTR